MCASTMQAQAAKKQLQGLDFKINVRSTDFSFDEKVIYPLQKMVLGRVDPQSGKREALVGQFGLVPYWVNDDKGGPKFGRYCYNARSETVFEKPSFKRAVLRQRAVVPVTSFFEFPDKEKPLKHLFRIHRKDGQAFWLAALWEYNKAYDLTSVSIVTTQPMSLIKTFHSRSPVVLDDEQLQAWLDPKIDQREPVASFLKTHSSTPFAVEKQKWKPKKGSKKKVK